MRKFTLFLMSLFLSVGAMAQNWTFEEINIASNADQMLYTNAPCTNTQWGDQFTSWTVLFDDNAETFLHTEYAQNGKSEDGLDHYIRVDLGAGNEISAFKFDYTTRGGNAGYDFPQKFIIAGSNEVNGTYTEIGRIESGCPIGIARSYSSNVFTSETPYRYLRFMVTETNTDRKGEGVEHNYWHMGEFRLYKATPYADYVHNTGNINRNDRGLTSFTITDGENSLTVNSIQTSAQAPVYVDKSAEKLTTKQGATLKFTDFNYTGSWMHAYAYIDYNKDYKFTLTNNNNGEGEGEIVSYNYYDGNDITGTPANQGSAIGNTYGESKAMPAFTLPRTLPAGEYRVRIKIDWNNLDADYGASDIAGNGGCQCDFTIVVEEAEGNEIAWNALNNAVDEALALFNDVKIGTSVGSYSSSIDGYEAEFNNIMSYKSSITVDTPSDEIDAKTARVREIIASFSLNMPKAGDYIRIKSIQGWNDDARYLGAQNSTVETSRAEFVAEAGANTIFYFDGENLISYASGNYLVNNSSFLGYNGVQTDGTVVEFRTSNNTSNRHAYNISFKGNDNATRWLYTNTGNYTDAGSSCGTEGGYNFNLEPVTELPVAVTAAGYATFFAPVAVSVPSGVTAHTVTINGEWATLSEALTVVPAETGVVLVAGEGSYNFVVTTAGAFEGENLMVGTIAKTLVTKPENTECYVLANGESGVGMYAAAIGTGENVDRTKFYNAGHKAYLAVEGAEGVKSLSFRFGEGTTGVENVEVENTVKVIYDLTGRRVEAITAPGIYIVNGKKVLVK